jgi:hypothetical protein
MVLFMPETKDSDVKERKIPEGRDPEIYSRYVDTHTTISLPKKLKVELEDLITWLASDPDNNIKTWDDFMRELYPILKETDFPAMKTWYKPTPDESFTTIWVSKDIVEMYKKDIFPRMKEPGKRKWQPVLTFIRNYFLEQQRAK